MLEIIFISVLLFFIIGLIAQISGVILVFVFFILLAIFIFFILIPRNKERVCNNCGYYGKGEIPGHFLMELLLWFLFFFPGMIYTVWRKVNNGKQCPKCKKLSLIDKNSPIGRDVIAKYNIDID